MTAASEIKFGKMPAPGESMYYTDSVDIYLDGDQVGELTRCNWRPESGGDCERGPSSGPWQVDLYEVTLTIGGTEISNLFHVPTNADEHGYVPSGWTKSAPKYTRAAAQDTLNRAKRWARENAHRIA